MKLGLDFHGVLDDEPEVFIKMARAVMKDMGEVHIITGHTNINKEMENRLMDLCNGDYFWSHIVSINDYLLKDGNSFFIDEHVRPCFDEEKWNRFKGDYCLENDIDLMIDDTLVYRNYFKTLFLRHIPRR